MANPTVTGAEEDTTGGATIAITAPTGMQNGDRIIVGIRGSASRDFTPPSGWTNHYLDAAHRMVVWVSPPLTVADGPWSGSASDNASFRWKWLSYAPGDDDPTPRLGTVGETAGSLGSIDTLYDGTLLVAFGSTTSSNTGWTAPSGYTDAGIWQPGFTNVIGMAYLEGVDGEQEGLTPTYSFSSTSNPNIGVVVAVDGPAPAAPSERTVSSVAANLSEASERTISTVAVNLQEGGARTVEAAANLSAVPTRTVSSVVANLSSSEERSITPVAANLGQVGNTRTITSVAANINQRHLGRPVPSGRATVRG